MSFADLFEDEMPHFVFVEPWNGQDETGAGTYGAAVMIPRCRVVFGAKIYRDQRGQELLSQAALYAGTEEIAIGPKDRVTLPDGSQPPILGLPRQYPDETGVVVQTVLFGRSA